MSQLSLYTARRSEEKGQKGWYPFLRKKGYHPPVLNLSVAATTSNTSTRRIDLLSRFSVIRYAYTHNSVEQAHLTLEKDVAQFGTKENSVIYVDGPQAVEKEHTAKIRLEALEKAVDRCEKSLGVLQERINESMKVRKKHFTDVKTSLASTFYWSLTMRESFVEYMTRAGWKVQTCATEADVAIARDCQPGDIVVSADSDMLAYSSISVLWRPVSRSLIFVYNILDICQILGMSRIQLTALAVVSNNDSGKNIFSLGPATNFSIIKSIEKPDVRETVKAYLEDSRVVSKNTDNKTFEYSLRVFVDLQQTPVSTPRRLSCILSHGELYERFKGLQVLYQKKKDSDAQQQPSTGKDQIIRLRSPQSFIRYRTVESPAMPRPGPGSRLSEPSSPQPPQQLAKNPLDVSVATSPPQESTDHAPLQRARTPRNRHRYSFKTRKGEMARPPPEKMKQHVFKPFKEKTDNSEESSDLDETIPKAKIKPKLKTLRTSTTSNKTRKLAITHHLAYHHPTSSLDVGTLQANVGRIAAISPILRSQIVQCLRDAVRDAASTKRRGQRFIGRFIEHVNRLGSQLESDDRVFLDLLCPRVTKKDAKDHKDGEDDDDEDDLTDLGSASTVKKGDHGSFIWSFLIHLYSGNYPRAHGVGQKVNSFIVRLGELGIYTPPRSRSEVNEKTPFTPSDLLESVSGQLRVELKKMYKNGSCDIHQKLKKMKKRGLLGPSVDIGIQESISAVENYLTLNKLSQNPRRIIPLTSSKQPFVAFSERELAGFFFSRGGVLRARMQELVNGGCTSIADVHEWISEKEPGCLIKSLLVDIAPGNLTVRQRGKAGHRAAIELPTLGELKIHLEALDDKDFQPKNYTRKRYFPRGTIRTNGFNIQVLCFKLRELLSVKYKRLPDDRLPPRLTSTVHGTGDFLTEIRNVLGTKEDVARLWPDVNPQDIKILTLDAGQAYVVGAYAHIPRSGKGKDLAHGTPLSVKVSFPATSTSTATTLTLVQPRGISTPPSAAHHKTHHHNLAVNQKAVMQPVFRYRRWLEEEKQLKPEGPEQQLPSKPDIKLQSIATIESQLPPLRGPHTSIVNYVTKLEEVEERLSDFYNGNNDCFRKHTWDMKRAKHVEYQAIANSLLQIVGGSQGEHRKGDNPVLIGIGLGKFGSSSRLSSLHSSFLSYFVPLARSLGYLVVGLNEFYTSKKCPDYENFVAQVTLRQFYCPRCKRYQHRDIMAAENMSKIVRGYLVDQERPEYLHPKTSDGRYPWKTSTNSGQGETGNASTTIPVSIPRPRKRAFISTLPQGSTKAAREI
ncbi:hypothetical protein BGZ83_010839 [Gryganskiella cystojenkinii]|nr:hypothetical protein BGZ83_010839 [Gryganskiella cystojenkinii]